MCKCRGTGWLVVKHKKNGGTYGFACDSCTASNRYPKIPRWDPKYFATYETDFDPIIRKRSVERMLGEKPDDTQTTPPPPIPPNDDPWL